MLYLNANYLTNLGMMYVHVEENTLTVPVFHDSGAGL